MEFYHISKATAEITLNTAGRFNDCRLNNANIQL